MSLNSDFQLKGLSVYLGFSIKEFPHLILLSKLGSFKPVLHTFKNNESLVISTDSSLRSTP